MSALTVMLIRHGEKPQSSDPSLGDGYMQDGTADDHSLVVRGWQRAGSWAALFGPRLTSPDYPTPDIVYAADPNDPPDADDTISKRPWETILPLCDRLQIKPVIKFGVGDEKPMLDEVRKLTGTILISWEHKKIAKIILPELTTSQTLPQLPHKWDSTRFDVVLRFDRAHSSADWSFKQLFPRLLAGDSDTPMV